MKKILIIICAAFLFCSSASLEPAQDCKPVVCPDDLKGNPRGGQLPCYLSVRDTKGYTATGKCKNCDGEILKVNNKWIHNTFATQSGGYIRCADHLAKQVCEFSTITTVAEP
jgi:hypothetical protein